MSAFWIAARASHDADLPCKQGETGLARSSTTFRRGTSGNPNGRPRVVFEIRDAARRYGPACITILAQMAGIDGPGATNEAVRVAAVRELLDRGFGRPTQAITTDPAAPSSTMLHLLAAQLVSAEIIERQSEPQPQTIQHEPQLQCLLDAPPPLE
jgi:hypothetical protein